MSKGFGQTFFQRGHTVANKHMMRFSAAVVLIKIHIKTTVRYDFTFTRLSRIKKDQ